MIKVYRFENPTTGGLFYDRTGEKIEAPIRIPMEYEEKLAIPNTKSGCKSVYAITKYMGVLNFLKLMFSANVPSIAEGQD